MPENKVINNKIIPRDISWLSFNGRVLQEANDPKVSLKSRIKFLGIFSNNLDEFFRVRVATLRRMLLLGKKNMHLEENPQQILDEIQWIVLQQQNEFHRIWENIITELEKEKIKLVDERHLTNEQQAFVKKFFEEEVRSNVIPLLVESIQQFPYLREKSLYLGVVMSKIDTAYEQKFALIEVPSNAVGRFVQLPSGEGEHAIILLEDVIRYNLPAIFSYFGYSHFTAHIFKVTKDAEIDIDTDLSTSFIQKIIKAIKNRRKGKTVRFVYDKEMDASLLEYLIRKLNLSRKDNIIPGGRIHNYRHFIDFPDLFNNQKQRLPALEHPDLFNKLQVTEVVLQKDVMLHFPYHSFHPIIDLLRESAMDPDVTEIKITAYRLAPKSKIINALINAVRNGKSVIVAIELRARFDEEANLEWKEKLELEGVKVVIGVDTMKVHAKICIIKKKIDKNYIQYSFVSTGNLNEQTARVYGDCCLLTSNKNIVTDIDRIFKFLEDPKLGIEYLEACSTLLVSPTNMRNQLLAFIDKEIKFARADKDAFIKVKLNSLSDKSLIEKLYEAAQSGVNIDMIVRGIFCVETENPTFKKEINAVSIIDEYLEHARVLIFGNGGKEKVFISSADWMVRNLDHRVEVAVPITDKAIQIELEDILNIQLSDNVKARILDNKLSNKYKKNSDVKEVRSQLETYKYLLDKLNKKTEETKVPLLNKQHS